MSGPFLLLHPVYTHNGVLISPTRKETSSEACQVTHTISTISRREFPSRSFPLQGKTPKEIHAILKETLACLLPGRAKDLSAPLYFVCWHGGNFTFAVAISVRLST